MPVIFLPRMTAEARPPARASAGPDRLVRWWRRRAERARRAAECRELLALGEGCWRDLGIGRALEETSKPDWCP